MNVKFIAFDSMGVRSMATLVETENGVFFIDPGSALAPYRYGLPPHKVEYEALSSFLGKIYEKIAECDYVIITHYHRDHYLFRNGEEDYYRGKIIYAKDPYKNINYSQRIRAHALYKKKGVEDIAKSLNFVDDRKLQVNDLRIIFSPPLPHGDCSTRLGWVLAVTIIEDEYKFMFASDTQGCMCDESLNYVLRINPDFLVISGPPTYLDRNGLLPSNTLRLVNGLKEGSVLVIDHHLLRDKNYVKHLESMRRTRRNITITTAAEYMGSEVKPLEAYRDLLWKD